MHPTEKTQILGAFLLFALGTIAQQPEPAAIIVRPPAYSTALVSQTVRFTCVAYGFPAPETVEWSTASGRNLTSLGNDSSSPSNSSSSSVRITQQNVTVNGTALLVASMELCGVSVDFTDEYTCSSHNGIGGEPVASSSASFFLTVLKTMEEPPSIILHPPASNTLVEGENIEVTCVAYGNPLPTITWSRHGCIKINNSTTDGVTMFSEIVTVEAVSMRRSTLKICSASGDDSGDYTCLAYNGVSGDGLAKSEVTFNILVAVPQPSDMPLATTSIMEPSSTVEPSTSSPNLLILIFLCVVAFIAAVVISVLVLLLICMRKKKQTSPKKEDKIWLWDPKNDHEEDDGHSMDDQILSQPEGNEEIGEHHFDNVENKTVE